MLITEFYNLTGVSVTPEEYEKIEKAYMDSPLNKQDYCKKFVADGGVVALAEARKLQIEELNAKYAESEEKVKKLQMELDRLLNWRPYEITENVSQSDYIKLFESAGTKVLSDDEAKKILNEFFGFELNKIKIIKTVPKLEKAVNNRLRMVGEYKREPVYNSTDWFYIRFDVQGYMYEAYNDQLRLFYN